MNELAIFEKALELKNPEQRSAYINKACGEDAELRRRIEALFRSYEQMGSFLQSDHPSAESISNELRISEEPGMVIGPYKLLQQIGEGGFGVVYMADQMEPVKRRVALKIIKPGMDSRQVIARFESERQALAMMDHPNIAKVLDAGTTDTGRPYFVMELVKGVPITQFCDEECLTPRQRLELFEPVCRAIQHAHQKGIIHRDIKPSNVLVARYDDRPVPKVIDFGVAKATQQQLTEKTVFTRFGQMIGTIDYMSPEQAELNQLDIDTRSDIYSLGVLLYELLTGALPFDRGRLRSAAFDEVLRIIREEEPPRPSMRLSTSESLPAIAAKRHMEPAKLSVQVRGELDWIVMKTLEKDRTRRYESAGGLADDLGRYLRDEAVTACPPSAAYRFRKYARRHRATILFVLMIVVVLTVGIMGTTWQAVIATQQRDRAVRAERLARGRYKSELDARRDAEKQRDRAVLAERRAKKEAEKAKTKTAITQAVNHFLQKDLLAQADPRNEPDRDIKLRTVVDRAAAKVKSRFADYPRVEVAVRTMLAGTYQALGEYEKAQEHFEQALEIDRELLSEEHPDTLTCMNNLALLHQVQGNYEQAERLHEKTLEIRRRVLGEKHSHTLSSMNNLALLYKAQGRYQEAEPLYKKTWEICREKFGEDNSATLTAMNNLAELYKAGRRYEEAEPLCKESLSICRRVLGQQHPQTLTAMNNLAMLYRAQGRHQEAQALLEEALEIRRRVLKEEHPDTLQTMNNLAMLYQSQGLHEKAEPLYEKVLAICRQRLRKGHPHTLVSMNNLAMVYMAQRRFQDTQPLLEEVLQARRQELREDHPKTLTTMKNLVTVYQSQGHHEQAEAILREAVGIWRKQKDTLDRSANWLAMLGLCLCDQQKYSDAEPIFREVLEIREANIPDDWRHYSAMSLLGASMLEQARAMRKTSVASETIEKKFVKAEKYMVQGYEGMKKREATIPPQIRDDRLTWGLRQIIELYEAWHKPEKVSHWLKKKEQAKEKE